MFEWLTAKDAGVIYNDFLREDVFLMYRGSVPLFFCVSRSTDSSKIAEETGKA